MKKYTLARYSKTPFYVLFGKAIRKIFETTIEMFTVPKLEDRFKHHPFSGQAMQKLLKDFEFNSVLDIGSGEGLHAKVLTDNGKEVTTLDYGDSIYYEKSTL